MNKKKRDIRNKVYCEFIGNNTIDVTGSATYLKFYDKDMDKDIQILLEFGGVQNGSILDNYRVNDTLINKVDAKNIDFVILLHQHLDHTQLVPALTANGFSGRIIMTKESKEIFPVMMSNAAFVNETEVKWLKDKKGVKVKPFYKSLDIINTMKLIDVIDLNEKIKLTPNIEINFLPSTHTLGSCVAELLFNDQNSHIHKLVYTSDIGNNMQTYFTYDSQIPSKTANILISESTYGKREKTTVNKNLRKKEMELLEKTLEETVIRGGSCLLPTFSFQRSPVMLKHLKTIMDNNEILKNISVYVDGNLTNDLMDVFSKVCEGKNKEDIKEILEWENLKRVRSYKETLFHLENPQSKIVIASAGFCHTGRVQLWLRDLLPSRKNTIIFSGYASPSSVAAKIKTKDETGQKTIKIDKFTVLMNAQIVSLSSFSSHIQRSDLISYISSTKVSDYTVLVHGELSGRQELAEDLQKRYDDDCATTKILIPKKNQALYF